MAITTGPFEKSNLIYQNNTPTCKKYKISKKYKIILLFNSLYVPHYFSLILSFDPYSFSYHQNLYLILPLHLGESERGPPHPPSIKNPTTKCDYYYENSQQQSHPIKNPNKR